MLVLCLFRIACITSYQTLIHSFLSGPRGSCHLPPGIRYTPSCAGFLAHNTYDPQLSSTSFSGIQHTAWLQLSSLLPSLPHIISPKYKSSWCGISSLPKGLMEKFRVRIRYWAEGGECTAWQEVLKPVPGEERSRQWEGSRENWGGPGNHQEWP